MFIFNSLDELADWLIKQGDAKFKEADLPSRSRLQKKDRLLGAAQELKSIGKMIKDGQIKLA